MKSRLLSGAVILFLAITACRGTFQVGLEPSTPSPTPAIPTVTLTPALTLPAPASTAISVPGSPAALSGTPTSLFKAGIWVRVIGPARKFIVQRVWKTTGCFS